MASNRDASIPSFIVNNETSINVIIASTNATLADQGYTYNQATFAYNQAGWKYGGIYNTNQDIAPQFTNDTASFIKPIISGIVDMYSQKGANSGMLLPIGLPFYFLTYP